MFNKIKTDENAVNATKCFLQQDTWYKKLSSPGFT